MRSVVSLALLSYGALSLADVDAMFALLFAAIGAALLSVRRRIRFRRYGVR